MKTIWRFVLDVTRDMVVKMPQGAEVLRFGYQDGKPCLWALVDDQATQVAHYFTLRMTGEPAEGLTKAQFVGALLVKGNGQVAQLFDLGES